MRRIFKRRAGGGGGGSSGGGGIGPVPIDPLTVEYWDAELGISLVAGNVDSWTGQKAGTVVSASGAGTRPFYATDPPLRGNTVQGTRAGRGLVSAALGSPIAAAGSRPYTICAYRLRNVPGAAEVWGVFDLGVLAASGLFYTSYQTFGGSVFRPSANVGAVLVPATAAADTAAHVAEFWMDGVNANVRDNGTLFQVVSAASLSANATAVAIGNSPGPGTNTSDISHVFHMICSAKPSDAYIATLRAWLARAKGTPP